MILGLDCSHGEALLSLEAAPGDCILRSSAGARDHGDWLGQTLHSLLAERQRRVAELERVALTIGPGSFTGLRVGLAFAKGLVFGSEIPLLPLSSLALPALAADEANRGVLVCRPARGRELWAASFLPGASEPSWEGLLPADELGAALDRLREAAPAARLLGTLPPDAAPELEILPEAPAAARLLVLARLAREGRQLVHGVERHELLPRYLLEPAVTLPGPERDGGPKP